MDINQACTDIQAFLEQYRDQHADWAPTEIRVLPSGDEMDTIKIWINFGDKARGDLDALAGRAVDALKQAHPAIASAYAFNVRGDAA